MPDLYLENAVQYLQALHMEPDCLNIKATTEEKLGFTGREEGIASQAVCLLYKK